jgi:hypothetical protein
MKNDYLQAAGRTALLIPRETKERFRAGLVLLDAASGNIREAGILFAGIKEAVWAQLIDEAPAPMRRTLSYVREVGEGKMIPQLATATGEAAQRLRTLPLADQLKLWTEPVEMFAPGRVGRAAKYMRYVTEMDSDEVKRAFARDGAKRWKLRSYDEQKAWEAELGRREEPEVLHGVDRPGRWAVRNGKVYLASAKVSAGLSKRDVELIMKDLGEE